MQPCLRECKYLRLMFDVVFLVSPQDSGATSSQTRGLPPDSPDDLNRLAKEWLKKVRQRGLPCPGRRRARQPNSIGKKRVFRPCAPPAEDPSTACHIESALGWWATLGITRLCMTECTSPLTLVQHVQCKLCKPDCNAGVVSRAMSTSAMLNVCASYAQSHEIIDLVAMLGLGDGNKTAAGRLRNDVRRSIKSVFSSKTRDKLKNTEQRMAVRGAWRCYIVFVA